jgi:MFS family permease
MSALTAYGTLLRKRQVQVVVGSSAVAGLSVGGPLAIVLMVEQETGSFASAGAVTAAMAIASAVAGPVQGRLIDRFGQSRTLPPQALANMALSIVLVAATLGGAPLAALIAIAALLGASSPSLLAAVRALWADLVDHPDQLATAYAIQAILVELFFISGPLVAAALIAVGSPEAAVLAISGARMLGMLAFAATPASRAWRAPPRATGQSARARRAGALVSPGMRTLIATDLPFGAMFGVLDVAVPAFAKAEGSPAAAGAVFAALAVGSMAGGIVYGRRTRRLDGRRYATLAAIQALFMLPLAFAGSLPALVVLVVVPGVLVAPISTLSFGLLDVVAPAGTPAEATSWVVTAYQVGLAAGTGVGGVIVEGSGTTAAFLLACGCGFAGAVIVGARRATLSGRLTAPT